MDRFWKMDLKLMDEEETKVILLMMLLLQGDVIPDS